MLLTFLGAIVLAVGVCGVISMIYKVLKKPMPKGALPLAAGVSMIVFMAWNENAWYSRQVADLPDTFKILRTGEFSNFIQPWTMIFPRTNRYMAVDTAAIVTNEFDSTIKAAEIIIAERYTPTRVRRQLINCQTSQAADFPANAPLDDKGLPQGINWFNLEAEDPLLAAAC